MTESQGVNPPLEPPRPMWVVDPEVVRHPPTAPPPRRRRRWLRELPFVVAGILVVGTVVTCGITQIFGEDEPAEPEAAASGDCFGVGPYAVGPTPIARLPEDVRDQVYPVSCGAPHTLETYRRGRFVGADADLADPDVARGSAQVIRACDESARDFLGGDYAEARVVTDLITPTKRGWAAGQRWYACVMAEVDGAFGEFVKRTDTLRDGLRGDRALAIGCVDVTASGGGELAKIGYVSCDGKHSGEFAGARRVNEGDAYPDDATMDAIADESCLPRVASYLGLTADQFDARKDLTYVWSGADEQGWRSGDRSLRCFVTTSDYKPVISGSVKGLGMAHLPS